MEQVGRALDLADEKSKSPNETRLRLIWVLDAGLAHPLVNRPVFDLSGRLLGVPDLFDPGPGLVGEFDGADHRTATRHSDDVGREQGFRGERLEFFRVTGPDLKDRDLVVARILSSLSRAACVPEHERTWTLTPPPDWDPEPTLDELLEDRAMMAEVYAEMERIH